MFEKEEEKREQPNNNHFVPFGSVPFQRMTIGNDGFKIFYSSLFVFVPFSIRLFMSITNILASCSLLLSPYALCGCLSALRKK
jgi:hypothetical protein